MPSTERSELSALDVATHTASATLLVTLDPAAMREQMRRLVAESFRKLGKPPSRDDFVPPPFDMRLVYSGSVDYETGWPRAARLETVTEGMGVKTVETTQFDRL